MIMMSVKKHLLAAAVGVLGVSAGLAVQAHHPISAKFDSTQSVALEGVVTSIDWRNPHAHILMSVTTEDGSIEDWAVELESPVILRANGWREHSVQPGDKLRVEGIQARNGSFQLWGEHIASADNPLKQLFTVENQRQAVELSRRTPRWSDGQPALGAIPGGADGYWAMPSASSLYEEGNEVTFDRFGLLENLEDADKVAPFQPWALALYKNRQQRELQDDPVYLNCKPPGGPRQFQTELGFQLIEDRATERVFVLMADGNRNFRVIYLDGRDQVGQVGGDDDNPLYYGRSTGQWQGDTLVLQTDSFNEDFWFSNGGLPHTDQLKMEERFTRVNQDTLHYQVTIDDSGAYTRPWTASWNLQWMGGQELPTHFCQHNRL